MRTDWIEGTPIIDSNLYRLISWLRFLVPFTVTERNLWSAAVNMVARRVEATGIPRIYEYADATFNESEESQWKRLMPPRLGGLNKMAGARDFAKAAEISYTTATRGMLAQVRVLLKEQKRRGVMLVARNATHAQEMYDELERMNVVPVSQVLLFVGASSVPKKGVKDKKTFSDDMGTRNVVTSVNLTPVNNTKKIRVVIVPYRRATGYTLTAMDSLVWTVYPSNQALRTQLEARIDRVGQTSDSLIYIKVVTPLLRLIAERHAAAKTLEDALSAVVKDAL
ncbi:hypothetical protein BJ742DRAFT_234840 [Cladochytrium replicatum]|nr:hypothetical protein BJ742DRAFT_234840 [Cladochytrium replicatum]